MGDAQTWDALLSTYAAEVDAPKPSWGREAIRPRRPLLATRHGGRVLPRAVLYDNAHAK